MKPTWPTISSLAVFLPFQASNQTDVENWVTAIHSASASHLAKRQGKEDTVRLLRSQSRALLQKIDMDSKMKKMAELQLSVITDQKNRKAVEGQVRIMIDIFSLCSFRIDLVGVQCNQKDVRYRL